MNHKQEFKYLKYIADIFVYLALPLYILTAILLIGWVVYFTIKCWRIYKEYKTCKQTPVLHPLYSDVQYLSKQRKLYNLKTHFTKYILMIVCCLVEIASFISVGSYFIMESQLRPLTNDTHLVIGYLNCTDVYFGWFAIYNEYSFVLPTLHFASLLFTLHLTLLTILSRYLAIRYLNHPFGRTCIKYLIWCSIQFILFVLGSTAYTWISFGIILLLIGLTNWILLLRATSFLSRVLRSHLMEIKLYSNNRAFYNTQLSAYSFYRIFRIVLLISTFSLILFEIIFFVWRPLKIFMYNSCQIQIGQTVLIPPFHLNNIRELLRYILYLFDALFCIVYIVALCIPLCSITFTPPIIRCVKRCREKEDQYRYNYEKLEFLLKRKY